ncbi:MAG: hypothetical protein M3066_05785 [Actinomycetota bacterium]|nr:hypothetical protein [Actinomycetota bacterium]
MAHRMVTLGAEVLFPVSDQHYGERAGRLRDPWGHQWMVAKRLEAFRATSRSDR